MRERWPNGAPASCSRGEDATVEAHEEMTLMVATVDGEVDLHAPMGRRELVTSLDVADAQRATGARSFQILFGPHNGSTRATLFAGFIPPGKAPWHYHLYDEIVWVPEGPGWLHIGDDTEELDPGSAFRLRTAAGARRRERERRPRADHRRRLHAGRQPVRCVPHARRRRRVPLRRVARVALGPRHVERRSTGCTHRRAPSGSASRSMRTSFPRGPIAIRAELEDAGAAVIDAEPHRDEALLAVHDPGLVDFLRTAWKHWDEAGLPDDPGQRDVVGYIFPTPGLLGKLEPRVPGGRSRRVPVPGASTR